MSIEQEILYLERQYWQLPDIQAIQKRLVALEQSLAQSGMYWPAPAATGISTTCCPSGLPTTLTCTDSFFGATTLTWNGSTAWTGCIVNSPYAGTGNHSGLGGAGQNCPAQTQIAVHYSFAASTCQLSISYRSKTPSIGDCPLQSDCTTATTFTYAIVNNGLTCSPFRITFPRPNQPANTAGTGTVTLTP